MADYATAVLLYCHFLRHFWFSKQSSLHALGYFRAKDKTSLPSRMLQSARRQAWRMRKNLPKHPIRPVMLGLEGRKDWIIRATDRGNPVLTFGLYRVLEKRKLPHSAFPIVKDEAWRRYENLVGQGWISRICMIHRTSSGRYIAQFWLKKEVPTLSTGNVIGVDVGLRCAAAITLLDQKTNTPIRQLYLGRDLLSKRKRLWKRKDHLRSLADNGSKRADRALQQLQRHEHNMVNWNVYHIAHQIVGLSKQYHADIVIENLWGLRRGVKKKGKKRVKKLNRQVHSMPYGSFRIALGMVSARAGVPMWTVSPRDTSKTCPRCGHVNRGNRPNGRVLFRCVRCGFEANSDRVASLNVARRYVESLNRPVERSVLGSLQPNHCKEPSVDQFSTGGVPTDAPIRSNEEAT